MFNHMCMISMFSFKSREITQMYKQLSEVLSCVRFLSATLLHFCSSWQSEFQNCSTETWRNILRYGGKHGECCV